MNYTEKLAYYRERYRKLSPEERKVINHARYMKNREQNIARTKLYHQKHPEVRKRATAKWVANNQEKRREIMRAYCLKRTFGMSVEQYNALFEFQEGRCAICGIDQSKLPGKLNVDHDHKTGKIRGLLCANCNHVLGKVHEDVDVLVAAAEYLKRHG